jgi:hypothetical protein
MMAPDTGSLNRRLRIYVLSYLINSDDYSFTDYMPLPEVKLAGSPQGGDRDVWREEDQTYTARLAG